MYLPSRRRHQIHGSFISRSADSHVLMFIRKRARISRSNCSDLRARGELRYRHSQKTRSTHSRYVITENSFPLWVSCSHSKISSTFAFPLAEDIFRDRPSLKVELLSEICTYIRSIVKKTHVNSVSSHYNGILVIFVTSITYTSCPECDSMLASVVTLIENEFAIPLA